MVKILGVGDLLATALLLATAFNFDILVDMLILFLLPQIILFIAALLIGIKGIMSLFAN